jgi:hypothetical protein
MNIKELKENKKIVNVPLPPNVGKIYQVEIKRYNYSFTNRFTLLPLMLLLEGETIK